MINDYLPAFPPSPDTSVSLLQKMDYAFSSLLKGKDFATGHDLPGFSSDRRAGFTKTDMVRLQNLVQKTRVLIVTLMGDDVQENNTHADTKTEPGYVEPCDISLAGVYQCTLTQLGETLDSDGYLKTQS